MRFSAWKRVHVRTLCLNAFWHHHVQGAHLRCVPCPPGFPLFCAPSNLTLCACVYEGCFQFDLTVYVDHRDLFLWRISEYSVGFMPPRSCDYISVKDTKHTGRPGFLIFFFFTSSDCSQRTCGAFHMFMWLAGYGPLPLLLLLFGGHLVIDHTSGSNRWASTEANADHIINWPPISRSNRKVWVRRRLGLDRPFVLATAVIFSFFCSISAVSWD